MYQPHNVHQLANAIHDDYRRTNRQPSAWAEASATLLRPPWQGAWRAIGKWIAFRSVNFYHNDKDSVGHGADSAVLVE